jgi:hypothetical protein
MALRTIEPPPTWVYPCTVSFIWCRCTCVVQVYLKENWGKHVRRDEVEVLVEGEPGGFIALNGMDWELYSRNRHLLLDRETVS